MKDNLFLTDSHCHLDDESFLPDLEQVLDRARSAGVRRIVTIGAISQSPGSARTVEICQNHNWIYGVVGLHPHEARMLSDELIEQIEKVLAYPFIVGVGETGLDFHYNYSPRNQQQNAFREMIRVAIRGGKPLVIHSREATEETLKILDEENGWQTGGVFHCFSGSYETAKYIISKGFYISFAGVITFSNAHRTVEVLKRLPTERVLIETDAPYLAPIPYRGRRNEPAYISITAARYAAIRNLSEPDIWRITSFNASKLFGLPFELKPSIAYVIRNSLYLNVTNKCTLSCKFCPKRKDWMVKGYFLRMEEEPSLQQIEEELRKFDLRSFDEVVFCGFGEPTQRLEVIMKLSKVLKEFGVRKIRLDTDGLGNLIYGRNIVDDLATYIDEVSVSLNAPDASTYALICPSKYGESAYQSVKEFIKLSQGKFKKVIATVVGMPQIDIEECRRIAEEELGVSFRVREYNEVG